MPPPTFGADDPHSHSHRTPTHTHTHVGVSRSPQAERNAASSGSPQEARKQQRHAPAVAGDGAEEGREVVEGAVLRGAGNGSQSRPGSSSSRAVSDRSGAAAADAEGASRGQRADVADGLASGER